MSAQHTVGVFRQISTASQASWEQRPASVLNPGTHVGRLHSKNHSLTAKKVIKWNSKPYLGFSKLRRGSRFSLQQRLLHSSCWCVSQQPPVSCVHPPRLLDCLSGLPSLPLHWLGTGIAITALSRLGRGDVVEKENLKIPSSS